MSGLAVTSTMLCEEATEEGQAAAAGVSSVDRFGVEWRGRRIGVVGLGKSGMAAARLLRRVGADVLASDAQDNEALRGNAAQLRRLGVERLALGRHESAWFDGCDALIVSPGVPESAPPLQWACQAEVPILSEVELAFRLCPAPMVAVTGTNGKSSAVTLLERLMRTAGRSAVACGNVGVPVSDVVPSVTAETTLIVEVSSFQLLWCHAFRPTIAVLLNVGTNHLDRHPNRSSYLAAKTRIFQRQTPHDYAVLNYQDPETVAIGQTLKAQRVWFGEGAPNHPRWTLDPATCRALPRNWQAVLQTARILDLPDPLTYQVMREFRGLEHRLEYVTTVNGVRIINDSKSTTPESVLYALEQCVGSVVPILGGRDKGLNFRLLAPALQQARIRGTVLIGESRASMRALFEGCCPIREGRTLPEGIVCALGLAKPGDTVLFSPGCASFDMFRNFEERGRIFKQLIRRHALNGHHLS